MRNAAKKNLLTFIIEIKVKVLVAQLTANHAQKKKTKFAKKHGYLIKIGGVKNFQKEKMLRQKFTER